MSKHVIKYQGFTLIEILVVIAIISIVASVATLTIHVNRNKQLETFAHQLVSVITLAEEEALLRPAVLGLALNANAWQFYQYHEENHSWVPLSDKALRSPPIPDHTKLTLTIHNQLIPNNGKPYLIISSNGDIPSFTIFIGKENEEPLYKVTGEEGGNVYAQ